MYKNRRNLTCAVLDGILTLPFSQPELLLSIEKKV